MGETMNYRIDKIYNLERILIDNIHLDITIIQNKIVNLKSFIYMLKTKEIKDKKILNKVDENIKEIESMMDDLGIDYKEKIKNNEFYSKIIKDILDKLFHYRNDVLSKCTCYKRLDLVGVDENIKYLISYIAALDQSIFDNKETGEEYIKKIKEKVSEIDTVIKKLDLGE